MDDYHDALRALIKDNGLTQRQAADLARVHETTIKSYLRPRTAAASRPVPLGVIELIRLKLAADSILKAAGNDAGNPFVRALAEARGAVQ